MGDAGAKYYSFCAPHSVQDTYATLPQKLGMFICARNKNFRPAVMHTQPLVQWLSDSVFSEAEAAGA